jgi:hypothetical protein
VSGEEYDRVIENDKKEENKKKEVRTVGNVMEIEDRQSLRISKKGESKRVIGNKCACVPINSHVQHIDDYISILSLDGCEGTFVIDEGGV